MEYTSPAPSSVSTNQPQIDQRKNKLILIIVLLIIILLIVIFLIFQLLTKTPLNPNITIPCPSIPKFCNDFKKVSVNGNYSGIGANLEPGSPLYAVFDGQKVVRPVTADEPFIEVDLISPDNMLRAYYFIKFIEDINPIQESFKKGEVIATVSAEPIKYFGDYNLIFRLHYNGKVIPSEDIVFK